MRPGIIAAALAASLIAASPAGARAKTTWTSSQAHAGCMQRAANGAYEETPQTAECEHLSVADLTGELRSRARWTAIAMDPLMGGFAYARPTLERSVHIVKPGASLTFTGTFDVTDAASSQAGAGTAHTHARVFVIGPCGDTCIIANDAALLTNAGQLPPGQATGRVTVSVTLTAPAGQTLPSGWYRLMQSLHSQAYGPRVLGSFAETGATATARGITYG